MLGVDNFLNFTFSENQYNKVLCPCRKCDNFYWKTRYIIEEHLIYDVFQDIYIILRRLVDGILRHSTDSKDCQLLDKVYSHFKG